MFGRGNSTGGQTILPDPPERPKAGKGRPTPKRREAERGRRRVAAAPANRKEALRRNREQRRQERRRHLQALRAGDERHLPPRDRGPVRSYVRDAVDARLSIGEFFLPLALVVFVLIYFGTTAMESFGRVLWLFLVTMMLIDGVVLVLRLRRTLPRKFPDEDRRGAAAYGLMRSMQIRRFRLPPPKVKPGGRPIQP